eukprot:TRINITY_DN2298_c0_g1_i2.p1 TRINITY_DN2298_c0_g1~~TRINITY_DN2298_c0_g1_i2.p1  ORF type:complete len:805 (-),score=310.53 TRINITY_DN2298_c0_g1_i2:26-2329(-)
MNAYTAVYNHCSMGPKGVSAGSAISPAAGSYKAPSANTGAGASFGGERLYHHMEAYLKKTLQAIYHKIISKFDSAARNPETTCSIYAEEWDKYLLVTKCINSIFANMNKNWIMKGGAKNVYELRKLCLILWRDEVYTKIKEQLRDSCLKLITNEREGEHINSSALHSTIQSFVGLSSNHIGLPSDKPTKSHIYDIYTTDFEAEFLAESELYFTMKASESITQDTISEYLLKAETRLSQENLRIDAYMNRDSTLAPLMSIFDKIYFDKYKEQISQDFASLIQDDRQPEMGRMYALMGRIPTGLDHVRSEFEAYVYNSGMKAIEASMKSPDKSKAYVDALLEQYRRFSYITESCFKADPSFVASLDKGFRKLINENAITVEAKSSTKSPQLLAKYSNTVLKKGPNSLEENEAEKLLDDIMMIFKYVEDKDVFMTYYINHLASRLIGGTSLSQNLEQYVLSKMKSVCGFEYISKLQKMFNDVQISQDLSDKFKENEQSRKIDFYSMVLANGTWPLQRTTDSYKFVLAPEMEVCTRTFEQFYMENHSGKKLTWLHHLSKGEVKTNFNKTSNVRYILQGSGEQLTLMLQFNYTASAADEIQVLTVANLLDRTGIPLANLSTHIRALLRCKALGISPQLADVAVDRIEPTHKLALNKNFKLPKGKIKHSLNVAARATEGENKAAGLTDPDADVHIQKLISDERSHTTQATIVRIMKSRKTLTHPQLVNEVIEQQKGKFKPTVPLVKKSIDILIEKEYLTRSNVDRVVSYTYLA